MSERAEGFQRRPAVWLSSGGILASKQGLARDDYSAPDIAQLYRARWEIELLFKELRSRFGLDEIQTTDAYIIEALIIMAGISLLMNRVIVDELQKLDAKLCDGGDDATESSAPLPRRRCSLAVERHAHLIQLYVILDLGYDLPDLDELLLWASRKPNPHRLRLREEVESGEFYLRIRLTRLAKSRPGDRRRLWNGGALTGARAPPPKSSTGEHRLLSLTQQLPHLECGLVRPYFRIGPASAPLN